VPRSLSFALVRCRAFRWECAPLHRSVVLILATAMTLAHANGAAGQARQFSLESTTALRLHNVDAEAATLDGKRGLRVTMSEEAVRRGQRMAQEARSRATTDRTLIPDQLVVIEGLEFANGIIEAEIAGAPAPGAAETARGFVGIAFRLQNDMRTFDAIYLRPTNGRAEDQERRNHAVQYISHPDWPWYRLRKESPSKYESYADLVPGVWTKIRIVVRGEQARLYLRDREQPTLIVHDLKTGPQAKGHVALWLDVGTVAHFRNLTVTPTAAVGGAR